ncbi:MAG: hypothetical protein RLZZ628_3758 [Bacteroidota bacterium]|jgi:hypothetical protein
MPPFLRLLLTIFILYGAFSFFFGSSKSTQKETKSKPNQEVSVSKIIPIQSLVGKSEKDVAQILGKGEQSEKVKPRNTPCQDKGCDKIAYQAGKYNVVYINGKADWITINNVSEYVLDEKAIALLGIEPRNASFKNPSMVIRWEQVEGINEISFFNNGSDKIDYIYVKAFTK